MSQDTAVLGVVNAIFIFILAAKAPKTGTEAISREKQTS